MFNLSELVRGGTFCLSKAGLKIGNGDVKDFDIAAPNGAGIDYCIDGIMYHKADCQDQPLTDTTSQADLTTCLHLICIDASGNLTSVKGTSVLTAELTAGAAALQWPTPTAGTCPIGAIKVVNSGGVFIGGTTALNAATVTETYYDLFCIPPGPMTS
jgi:hypothetical protein